LLVYRFAAGTGIGRLHRRAAIQRADADNHIAGSDRNRAVPHGHLSTTHGDPIATHRHARTNHVPYATADT